MIVRLTSTAAVVAIVMAAVACDRTETSSAAVTSTSPAGSSTAPSSDSAKRREEALMRVVQATPSGSNMDLFAGDLLLFDGLAFKTVTPYRAIDGQRYAISLRPAGMTRAKPLTTNTENLKDGEFYTAFAMPGDNDAGAHLRVAQDHLDAPASGKARLRVVHAGVAAGRVHLRAAGATDNLVDGVDYRAVGEYRDVSPLNGTVEVLGDDQSSPVLATLNLHVEAGRFYTVVIVGNARTTPRLEAFLIEDALAP